MNTDHNSQADPAGVDKVCLPRRIMDKEEAWAFAMAQLDELDRIGYHGDVCGTKPCTAPNTLLYGKVEIAELLDALFPERE
jgi:hypothetical protein